MCKYLCNYNELCQKEKKTNIFSRSSISAVHALKLVTAVNISAVSCFELLCGVLASVQHHMAAESTGPVQ